MLKYEGREMSKEYPDLVPGKYAIRWLFVLGCIAGWLLVATYLIG